MPIHVSLLYFFFNRIIQCTNVKWSTNNLILKICVCIYYVRVCPCESVCVFCVCGLCVSVCVCMCMYVKYVRGKLYIQYTQVWMLIICSIWFLQAKKFKLYTTDDVSHRMVALIDSKQADNIITDLCEMSKQLKP